MSYKNTTDSNSVTTISLTISVLTVSHKSSSAIPLSATRIPLNCFLLVTPTTTSVPQASNRVNTTKVSREMIENEKLYGRAKCILPTSGKTAGNGNVEPSVFLGVMMAVSGKGMSTSCQKQCHTHLHHHMSLHHHVHSQNHTHIKHHMHLNHHMHLHHHMHLQHYMHWNWFNLALSLLPRFHSDGSYARLKTVIFSQAGVASTPE